MQFEALWGRFKANRLAFSLVILLTLTVGILIGTVVSGHVRGQERKSDATPLSVPAPRQLSNQFAQVAKSLEPAVVNIFSVSRLTPRFTLFPCTTLFGITLATGLVVD